MDGLVVSVKCGIYSVLANGTIYHTSARGLFRNVHEKILVGDNVTLNDSSFIIESLKPRTSKLIRPSIANISQIVVVLSLVEPEFSYSLAFKYLTYANMNGVKACLVLTKTDRFNNADKIKEIENVFNKSGIRTYFVSNKTNEGISEINALFKDEITCLLGQTGVGKSSLLNVIDPNYERAIGEYSKALGRGKHQTKEVILLPYLNGYIADTPGFSSLDLNLKDVDLAKFFPGFLDLSLKCYFSNCLHVSENKCAVKEALANGEIDPIAYDCYLKLINESRGK